MNGEFFEIEDLRSAVMQESKFRHTLEEYCNDLATAIAELEEHKQKGDDQSSEWKTRFEIQQEINEQLRKQRVWMQEKVAKAATAAQDLKKSARTGESLGTGTATESMLVALEMEKQSLSSQLVNIELRVDQEAKAYHKANEERKAVQLEIGGVNAQLSALKMSLSAGGGVVGVSSGELSAAPGSQQMHQRSLQKSSSGVAPKNIPPNQRIIDPKKGPVKKTAAVKQLPPL